MKEVIENKQLTMVITTESSLSKAENLALFLLEKRLAACVSLETIHSRYLWNDRVEHGQETQLRIKTFDCLLARVLKAINERHSYDIPEIIYWKISAEKKLSKMGRRCYWLV